MVSARSVRSLPTAPTSTSRASRLGSACDRQPKICLTVYSRRSDQSRPVSVRSSCTQWAMPIQTERAPKKIPGKQGWQPDGSNLTPEGEQLTEAVARASYLQTVKHWIIAPHMRWGKGVAGAASIVGCGRSEEQRGG